MRRQTPKAPYHNTPIAFALPTLAEARALQALSRGEATQEQQKKAVGWILLRACGAGNEMLVPGQSDTTAYLAGRRSVSLQIGWVLGQPADAFRTEGEQD